MTVVMMGAWNALRQLLGLADASDTHPTPSHGWLLPAPAALVRMRSTPPLRPASADRANR